MTVDGMPESTPFVYAQGSEVVYVDARDEPWEIRDYMRISGRIVRLRHRSEAAEYRLFAPPRGPCRLYAFDPLESREPEADLLGRQFGSALPTRSATTQALQDEPLLTLVPAMDEGVSYAEACS